mgnify:CR=1 FL=1
MRKQLRRHGRLIQKKTRKTIQESKFRVIATTIDLSQAWLVGEYSTLKEARAFVDNASPIGVSYYVHSDSSRVLYSKKGVVDAKF